MEREVEFFERLGWGVLEGIVSEERRVFGEIEVLWKGGWGGIVGNEI